MREEDLRLILIDGIREIQELNGHTLFEISDDIRPVGDLEQFDSLNVIELTIILSSRLGISIPEHVFYAPPESSYPLGETLRSLTVGQILMNLCTIVI